MSPRFHLRVQSGVRDLDLLPAGDDALGHALFERAAGVLDRGTPRPVMLVLREQQVDQVDVVPLLQAEPAHRERMLSAVAAQDAVTCAALVGGLTLHRRRRGEVVATTRAIVVYLEWPDNRWWTAWQPVDATRSLLGDGPMVRRAVDGEPRPGGIGGWFARARRERLKLRLHRPAGQEGLDLVH